MNKHYHIVLIICFCLSAINCKKEFVEQAIPLCPQRIDLDDIKPQGQSLSWIRYAKNDRITFVDSIGNKTESVILSDLKYGLKSFQEVFTTCKDDPTLQVQVRYNVMRHFLRLENTTPNESSFHIFELEISCLYNAASPLLNQRLDVMTIYRISAGILNNEVRNEIISIPLMENPYSIFNFEHEYFPTLRILNKEYQKVFSNRQISSDQWNIYYTKDLGIIGFRNDRGTYYVLQN